MAGCSDKPVTADQLPEPVKAFIQQNFPDRNISYVEKDVELTGTQYGVFLADGTKVSFDTDNMWDEIECNLTNPVPTNLIPEVIVQNLQTNFPDVMVLKIDKDNNGYDVELSNGLELKFNKQGVLREVDD